MQTALLIFIVIFALAIGFFLGLFLLSLNSPLLKNLFQKDDPDPDGLVNETSESAAAAISIPQSSKPSPESRLILQVWKEEGQPPLYDLDGKYLKKEELPKDILNIITLHEEPSQKPEVPSKQPPSAVTPATVESKPEPKPEPDEEDETESKMLSVVDEVNNILQKKLHGSPLAGKGIHLMENHNREIRFWVGLNSYNDVEEIPDQEIQKMIDESVREWEQNRK